MRGQMHFRMLISGNHRVRSILAATALYLGGSGIIQAVAREKPYASPASKGGYRITAIRGFLYYQSTGKFGDIDILSGKVSLRNSFVGEADGETPSGATLILIDLEGPDFARGVPNTLVVKASARIGSREAGAADLRIKDFYSSSRQIAVPFIVYGGPCEPLHISAALVGVQEKMNLSAVAPFSCGE